MALPVWLRGRDVALVITPQTESATGVLTAGASQTLVGQVDDSDVNSEPETDEVSPMDAVRQNHHIVKENHTVVIRELLKRAGPNYLATMSATYDVFLIQVTRGAQVWAFTGRRGSYRENLVKSRSRGELTLLQVDPGVVNPIYV